MSISITIDQKPIKFVAYRYDRPNQLLSLLRVGEKTVVTMPSGYDPDREGLPLSLTPEYEEAHDREVVTISTDSERPSTIRTVHVSRHILRWRAVLANGWTRECHVHDGPKPLNGEDLLVLAAARTSDHAHSDADDVSCAEGMAQAELWATMRAKYKELRSDWRKLAALKVSEAEHQTFFVWLDANGNMAETARRINKLNEKNRTKRARPLVRQNIAYRLGSFSRKTGIPLDTGKAGARKAPLFD